MAIDLQQELKKAQTEEEVANACTIWLQQVEAERTNVAGLRQAAVLTMREEGLSVRAIAQKLDLSRWVVQALLKGARSEACTPPNTP
jgi:DNA-binding NarL/FixJ family response regulator